MRHLSEELIVVHSIAEHENVRDHEPNVISEEVVLKILRIPLVEDYRLFEARRAHLFQTRVNAHQGGPAVVDVLDY